MSRVSQSPLSGQDTPHIDAVSAAAVQFPNDESANLRNTNLLNTVRELGKGLLHNTVDDLVMTLAGTGISKRDLVNIVIPDAASQLGEQWLDDTVSFADVTIGTSRLQQIVRSLDTPRTYSETSGFTSEQALLIIPQNEQHSLGATVIAHQLRDLGLNVDFVFEDNISKICGKIRNEAYSFAGLTLGSTASVKRAGPIIETLKNSGLTAPVVLGGAVIAENKTKIISSSGADFFARTAREALDLCGVCVPRNGIASK